MRSLLVALITLASSTVALASDITLVRVWPGYRTADSFMRISEYFTGKEHLGRKQTLLRTQPEQREGFYFLTRVANKGTALDDAQIELRIITPRSPHEATFTFKTTIPRGENVFQVGLTGADWPLAAEHPVAWRMIVLGANGQELASDQSFLWSKPASP